MANNKHKDHYLNMHKAFLSMNDKEFTHDLLENGVDQMTIEIAFDALMTIELLITRHHAKLKGFEIDFKTPLLKEEERL